MIRTGTFQPLLLGNLTFEIVVVDVHGHVFERLGKLGLIDLGLVGVIRARMVEGFTQGGQVGFPQRIKVASDSRPNRYPALILVSRLSDDAEKPHLREQPHALPPL